MTIIAKTTALSKVSRLLGESRSKVPLLFMFFCCMSIFDISSLYLIQPVTASFTNSGTDYALISYLQAVTGIEFDTLTLTAVLIFSFFLKFFIALYVNYRIISFAQGQQKAIRLRLFRTTLSLSLGRFEQTQPSQLVYNLHVLTQQYSNNVLVPLLKASSDLIIGIIVGVYLISVAPVPTFILALMFSVGYFVYTGLFNKKMNFYGKEANAAASDVASIVTESFSGFREIRVFGSLPQLVLRLGEYCDAYGRNFLRYILISTMPRYYFELIFSLGLGIVLVIFSSSLAPEANLFETLAVFVVASLRLLPTLHQLSNLRMLLKFNDDCLDRLLEFWDERFVDRETSGVNQPRAFSSTPKDNIVVALEDVCFERDKPLFSNVTGNFMSGRHSAIVGASGIGKSTFLDLFMGMRDPNEGKINFSVNGKPLLASSFIEYCTVITQEPLILSGTLGQNISMFADADSYDEERAREAIKFACLDLASQETENVLEMAVEQFGSNLSGGQKQRVAWSRAYYSNAPVWIVDEGTSALDHETEVALLNNISSVLRNKLVLFVTHRPERLKEFDDILELTRGGFKDAKSKFL